MDDFIYVYHGSNTKIEEPDAQHNSKYFYELDFGTGFYTTADLDIAKIWAMSKSEGDVATATVTRYKFYVSDALRNCSFIDFGALNDEYYSWMEAIVQCRVFQEELTDCQIIFGPISDDNGYVLLLGYIDDNKLAQYSIANSYLDAVNTPDLALVDLLEESPGEQIVFKDKQSLNYLIYDGIEEIEW